MERLFGIHPQCGPHVFECCRRHSCRGGQNWNPSGYKRTKCLQGCVVLSKLGAPLFGEMGLVYDHEENAATPSWLSEERRKSAVAKTHLWRRQNDPVEFFLQVLLVW